MPRIRHDGVEGTAVVSEAVLPFWTGPAGWRLVDDEPTPRTRRSRPRAPRPRAPQSPPASQAGAPDDVPGQGSSTTTSTEE